MSDRKPLMPKATAVWLVENTSLSFEQIAEFCGLHALEVKGIADGDVAHGIKGMDPISSGQLSREEIRRGEEDHGHVLRLASVQVPAMPDDLLDLAAVQAHHREVRGLLEAAMPAVLDHEPARVAAVQLFRDRAERYPLATRPQGGFAAHAAR